MCKLTIIIPFFNTEKYIEKCIQSILNQDLEDIQIILINDGSTDSSRMIAEKYVLKDGRFLLLNKENGGQSSARNLALKYANGKYIMYVDSDDFLEENVLLKIVSLLEENSLDILRPLLCRISDGVKKCSSDYSNENEVLSGCDKLKGNDIKYSLCNHVYKRDFLLKNNLHFLEGLSHEDMAYVPESMYYAERMMDVNFCFYNYVRRAESTTNAINEKRIDEYFQVAREISQFSKNKVDKQMREAFFDEYSFFLYSHVINMCANAGIDMKKYFGMEKRREMLETLKKGKSTKQKMIYVLFKTRCYVFLKVAYYLGEKRNNLQKLYE